MSLKFYLYCLAYFGFLDFPINRNIPAMTKNPIPIANSWVPDSKFSNLSESLNNPFNPKTLPITKNTIAKILDNDNSVQTPDYFFSLNY